MALEVPDQDLVEPSLWASGEGARWKRREHVGNKSMSQRTKKRKSLGCYNPLPRYVSNDLKNSYKDPPLKVPPHPNSSILEQKPLTYGPLEDHLSNQNKVYSQHYTTITTI
jgi:hypothetical protein